MVARNPRQHSTRGPMQVSTIPNPDPYFLRYSNAHQQLGYPIIDMSDMEAQIGGNIVQTNQSPANWTRQNTAAAFVEVCYLVLKNYLIFI